MKGGWENDADIGSDRYVRHVSARACLRLSRLRTSEGPPWGGPSSDAGGRLRRRRLWYGAELDEHSQRVHQLPLLGDLPPGQA